MNWSWLLKLLIPLFGEILLRYVLPLLNREVKQPLERILPVAERWVAAVETTGMSGVGKRLAATREILAELRANGLTGIEKGLVDTAIQFAWLKLGFNKTGTKA